MRVLSLGAGAIGGYFGGRLVQAGADVTFLVRPARKAVLAARGLVIESALGNFASPIRAVTGDELQRQAPFDVILLTCKAYDLPVSIDAIAPAVNDDTAVLPLLNGLSHMDMLNARFGRERVWGGLARIAATLGPDGTVKHLNDWRQILFGEQTGAMTPRLSAFANAFGTTQAQVTAVPDIKFAMWDKLVQLATVAGMTSLMRASIGEIVRAGAGPLLLELLDTACAVAAKEGFPLSQKSIDDYRRAFADPDTTFASSMLRDMERGGPIESDHIVGYVLDKARSHGLSAKLLEVIYAHLKAYEARRAAGRLP